MKLNFNASLKKGAFTLIELVISISITVLIFTVLLGLFNSTVISFKKSDEKLNSLNNSYLFFEFFRDDLEKGDSVVINKNKNSIGIGIINRYSKNSEYPYKYTYYSLEDGNIFRNTQKSKVEYREKEFVNGKFGKNKVIENVENIELLKEDGYINLKMYLDDDNPLERIYAIRSKNEE